MYPLDMDMLRKIEENRQRALTRRMQRQAEQADEQEDDAFSFDGNHEQVTATVADLGLGMCNAGSADDDAPCTVFPLLAED